MADMCGDNRFEIIAKAKADLLEGTNIETDEAEMAVLDNILFRCWQMGWLDRYDRKDENSSEKPNNCEHITEDGVTCAKYPACDDCLDNPLNKVKGSKRLLKGKDEPQKKEVEWVYNKRERLWYPYSNGELLFKDEPQTDCAWMKGE